MLNSMINTYSRKKQIFVPIIIASIFVLLRSLIYFFSGRLLAGSAPVSGLALTYNVLGTVDVLVSSIGLIVGPLILLILLLTKNSEFGNWRLFWSIVAWSLSISGILMLFSVLSALGGLS